MPIKNRDRKIAQRGWIKIGGLGDERPKKNKPNEKYRLPVMYDHFVITTMEKDAAERFMADRDLMQRLGKEDGPKIADGPYKGLPVIKEIPIRLLWDDNELNFQSGLACYKVVRVNGADSLRCWCCGDNEKARRLDDQGNYKDVSCPCERLEPGYTKPDICKPMGTLLCLIESAMRVGGAWRFRTSGWNSIDGIIESMDMIKAVTGGGQIDSDGKPVGPLAWVPLKMMICPKSTVVPKTGQRTIVQVVHLEFDGLDDRLRELGLEIMRKRIDHRMQMFNLQKKGAFLLEAPIEESIEEQQETGEEFFPRGVAPENGKTVQDPGAEHSNQERNGQDPDPPGSGSSHAPEHNKMTIPEVIEVCQAKSFIPDFPIILFTTKGVRIGEWVGRKSEGEEIQLLFEMVPEMTSMTGLTQKRIATTFKEAGYKVIFGEPGAMKQAPATPNETGEPGNEVPPGYDGHAPNGGAAKANTKNGNNRLF